MDKGRGGEGWRKERREGGGETEAKGAWIVSDEGFGGGNRILPDSFYFQSPSFLSFPLPFPKRPFIIYQPHDASVSFSLNVASLSLLR